MEKVVVSKEKKNVGVQFMDAIYILRKSVLGVWRNLRRGRICVEEIERVYRISLPEMSAKELKAET